MGEDLGFEAGTGTRKARLDAAISSRSSHSTVDIWAYATRAITDKAGFSLAIDQSTVRIGTVDLLGTLGTQAKADVNAEVVDVLRTDTLTELALGAPVAQPALDRAIMFIYMDMRNKITQTGSLRTIFNDAGTAIIKSTLSDDGTTFTKEEYISA